MFLLCFYDWTLVIILQLVSITAYNCNINGPFPFLQVFCVLGIIMNIQH